MPFDEYFDRRSNAFASFYRSRGFARWIGRSALFERLDFALDVARETGAKRVLDIGCGSGPLFGPLVELGIEVVGIEPAPGMIELARQEAARVGGSVDIVPIGWEGIEEWFDGRRFDLAVALGVFDYVPNAGDLMRVMGTVANGLVASFPTPGTRTNFRKVRYGVRGVQVIGYSRDRIRALATGAGLTPTELHPLGRAGYALHARRTD